MGRRGFLAWDISETLGYLRSACACELISMEEYQELSQYWVDQAAAFHSWMSTLWTWYAAPPTGLSALEASRTPSPTGI